MVGNAVAFRAARIPIRNPAVAATDNGQRAPEPAVGIKAARSASRAPELRPAPARGAPLTIGHVEGRDGLSCMVDGARPPALAEHHARSAAGTRPRESLRRGHRFEQRAPSRRMSALVSIVSAHPPARRTRRRPTGD